jgi:g-D-glutamyl-meso-diaminopimelate peptidase
MDVYQETQFFFDGIQTEKRIIGKSAFGRKIYACKMGDGFPVGIVQYAIHGREWITAKLAFAQFFRGVAKGCVWFIPLLNPDGALLSQTGISSVPKKTDVERLMALNGNEDFSQWKANGRGVDLNVNFPALWGKGAKNVFTAGAENYVGVKPFSEPETVALRDFTLKIKPDYTLSYHTKGEEIYWYFHQSMRYIARDKALAVALSKQTGYPLKHAKNSVGGYKDWCIQTLKIPAFTIEAGLDKYPHPLGEEAFDDILQKNIDAVYTISKEYR